MDDDDLGLIAEAWGGISEREKNRIREGAEERRRRRDNLAVREQDANELKRGLFHLLSKEERGGGGKRGGVMESPAIGLEKCPLHTRIDEEGE